MNTFQKSVVLRSLYGDLAAYLFLRSLSKCLTIQDVELAFSFLGDNDSTIIKVAAGIIDKTDVNFMAREILRAAAYDGNWEYIPEEE